MNDVNWWLAAVAFVLGLMLTGAFMIRRVTGEVPIAAVSLTTPAEIEAPKASAPTPDVERSSTAAPPVVDPLSGPHGAGSAKPGAGGRGPEGWTVKGNEESKLYHSVESRSYAVTRAEVWFRDVETAEAAGFNRWDSGKSQRGKKP